MTFALEGTRILDLTHVWSGPLAGRILADLGAQVIKISSRAMIDAEPISPEDAEFIGVYPDNDPGMRPWNRHVLENDLNRNKLGVTLELNTFQGAEVFKRLAKISDVVLENFSPRVMKNFGLGYPTLKQIHPGIIMCSMPAYGLTGPYQDYIAFGTNIEPACGLSGITGYVDGEPKLSGNPYPDAAAAMHAVAAILTALFFRHTSGKGQQIDLSQCESATCLIGESILGYSWRLLLASFVAYLAGEFSNSYVLAKMKVKTNGRLLWARTIGSTVIGQGLDSSVFILIAFSWGMPWGDLGIMILTHWLVKTGYEALATPFTYKIVNYLKRKEGIDAYDKDINFNPLLITD